VSISGLVIGSRKAGTTWIYENLKSNPNFCVSEKVKESGFFTGESGLTYTEYENLFDNYNHGEIKVEVDASVCYSDKFPECIKQYASQSRVILILRNPSEYLVSRYIHSKRKGEIKQNSITEAIKQNEWLRDEIDYPKIVARLSEFKKEQVLILPFEYLLKDPKCFYNDIVVFLSNGCVTTDPQEIIQEKINVARNSKLPFLSKLLSSSAKLVRKLGLHGVVNAFKKTGILRLIDSGIKKNDKELLLTEASKLVMEDFKESLRIWQMIQK